MLLASVCAAAVGAGRSGVGAGAVALADVGDQAAGNERVVQVAADDFLRPQPPARIPDALRRVVADAHGLVKDAVHRRQDQRRGHRGEQDLDQREAAARFHFVVDEDVPVVVVVVPAAVDDALTTVVSRTLCSLPCTG